MVNGVCCMPCCMLIGTKRLPLCRLYVVLWQKFCWGKILQTLALLMPSQANPSGHTAIHPSIHRTIQPFIQPIVHIYWATHSSCLNPAIYMCVCMYVDVATTFKQSFDDLHPFLIQLTYIGVHMWRRDNWELTKISFGVIFAKKKNQKKY